MSDIAVKRGETVDIEANLQDGNGNAVDLTGAVVYFQARTSAGDTLKIDRLATVVTPSTALVRASLTSDDTDTRGNYKAEWRAVYAGGYRIFPEDGYLSMKIAEDLAP